MDVEEGFVCACCDDVVYPNEQGFHMEGVGIVCWVCFDEYCGLPYTDNGD